MHAESAMAARAMSNYARILPAMLGMATAIWAVIGLLAILMVAIVVV